MDGDLTCHLLFEAGASGLLRQLNLYDADDRVRLNNALYRIMNEKRADIYRMRILSSLVDRICLLLAAGSEGRMNLYDAQREITQEIFTEFYNHTWGRYSKEPDKNESGKVEEESTSSKPANVYEELVQEYKQRFGDVQELTDRQSRQQKINIDTDRKKQIVQQMLETS